MRENFINSPPQPKITGSSKTVHRAVTKTNTTHSQREGPPKYHT